MSGALQYDWLRADAEAVMDGRASVEREVTARDGRHYLMRMVPYRGVGGQVEGVVVTFVDVTQLRAETAGRQAADERFELLSRSGLMGIAFLDEAGAFVQANDALLTLFGYARAELDGGAIRLEQLTPVEWRPRVNEALQEFRDTGKIVPFQREYLRRDGSRFWGLLGAARLEGQRQGVAFIIDVTVRRHPAPDER